jgi:hypothetical protein
MESLLERLQLPLSARGDSYVGNDVRSNGAMYDDTYSAQLSARLDAALATLGKSAGPRWGKEQKEAAAAALVALG